MGALYQFNNVIAEALEGFLESAVPMIAGLAEVIGLFIIVTSLARATFHYIRAFFFHERFAESGIGGALGGYLRAAGTDEPSAPH